MVGARAVFLSAGVLASFAVFVTLTAVQPALGAGVAVGVFLLGVVGHVFGRLPQIYLWLLGGGLVGYAFFGRGFAYVGYSPVFVGEVLLLAGVLTLVAHGRALRSASSPLMWPPLAFMLVGLASTLPYVGAHGLDALRDGVLWGYAAFAFVVAGLVTEERQIWSAVRRFRAIIPVYLFFVPVMTVLITATDFTGPFTPFSDTRLITFKSGDIAVHLSGILAFLMLNVDGRVRSRADLPWWHNEWLVWLAWIGSLVTSLSSRAAMLTLAAVATVTMLTRPNTKWLRLGALVALLVLLAVSFDVEVMTERGRVISPETVVVAFQSILDSSVSESDYDGTRDWRLRWWRDIVDYTVFGPYFWTGKGYGVNLATADGYQVWEDESLRSPHNGHLTVLARSGVPGAVVWLVLNLAWATALLTASRKRRREGRMAWATLDLWLLVYWLAFVINGSFDVFFEGPQMGIMYWCLLGFSVTALRLQASSERTPA